MVHAGVPRERCAHTLRGAARRVPLLEALHGAVPPTSPLATAAPRRSCARAETLATAIEMIFNAIFRHLECNPAQLKPIPRCAGKGWAGAGGHAGRRGGSRTLPFLCQQRVAAGDTLLTRGFPAALNTASQTRAAWVCQDATLGAVAPVTPSVLSIRGWGRAPTWVRFGALGLSLHLASLFPRVSSSEAPGSVTQHGAMCFEEATGRRVAVPLPGLLMAATSRGSQLSAHHGGAFVC